MASERSSQDKTSENKQVALLDGIKAARKIQKLFLDNRFEDARRSSKLWKSQSMYHALSSCIMLFIKAMMTFDKQDIQEALGECEATIELCKKRRKRHAIVEFFLGKKNENDFVSDEELHAELCFAECQLYRGILSFLQGESILNLLNGANKLRQCYRTYKACQKLLEKETRKMGRKVKDELDGGLQMGLGIVEVVLSSLNPKHVKMLGFLGVDAPVDKKSGINKLRSCVGRNTLRSNLSAALLLSWNLWVVLLLGYEKPDCDWDLCALLLRRLKLQNPNGFLSFFFEGRFQLGKGNPDLGIAAMVSSIQCQNEWPQLHNICFFELCLAYCNKGMWDLAEKNAWLLLKGSQWSPAFCSFFVGVLKLAQSSKDSSEALLYLRNVPNLKIRRAGKSVPIESFCVAKVEKFNKKNRLPLAHLELLNLWNGFDTISKAENSAQLLKTFLEDIDKVIFQGDADPDEFSLALLLKGICLKHLGEPEQASIHLRRIFSLEKRLTASAEYLAPAAHLEMARMYMEGGQMTKAKEALRKAKDRKPYLLEARLLFKIQSLSDMIN